MDMHQTHCRPAPSAHVACGRFALPWLLALLILGSGCASDGRWASPQVSEVASDSFAVTWSADLPLSGSLLEQLHINENLLFAYDSQNVGYFISRDSGHLRVIKELDRPIARIFPPVTVEDRIVIPTSNHLMIFDRQGNFAHEVFMRFGIASGGAGFGEYVYVGLATFLARQDQATQGGRLVAMPTYPQPYDTGPRWEVAVPQSYITAAPVIYERQLFAAARDGGVFSVRPGTPPQAGWPLLQRGIFQTQGPVLADLKADEDGLYVASADTRLYCIDRDTGRLRWVYYSTQPLEHASTPIPLADSVYIYVPRVGVAAITKAGEGTVRAPRWVVSEAVQFLASDDTNIYLRTADNHIIGVDKVDGRVKMRSQRGDLRVFATNTTTRDGMIYAGTQRGRVLAIRPVLKPGTFGEYVLGVPATAEAVAAAR